jgi:hypothetical protein
MARTPVMAGKKKNFRLKSSGKETGGCTKKNLEEEPKDREK